MYRIRTCRQNFNHYNYWSLDNHVQTSSLLALYCLFCPEFFPPFFLLCSVTTHHDRVSSFFGLHLLQDPENHIQAVVIELGKLPGTAIVAASRSHPDLTRGVQYVLFQVRGSWITASILCKATKTTNKTCNSVLVHITILFPNYSGHEVIIHYLAMPDQLVTTTQCQLRHSYEKGYFFSY